MGIVTTSSETAFTRSAEAVYDFVTSPANWPTTYPGGAHVTNLPDHLPIKIGDTWDEPRSPANSPSRKNPLAFENAGENAVGLRAPRRGFPMLGGRVERPPQCGSLQFEQLPTGVPRR
jgi:hypothetical protein